MKPSGQASKPILIVGVNYWPEPTGIGPYTTAFAERLAARGDEVIVLTGVPHYPQWKAQPGYPRLRRVRSVERGVTVIRTPVFVPGKMGASSRAAFEVSFLSHLVSAWRLPSPQAIVAIVPSLSGGVVGRVLGRRFGAPYGVIFQDLIGPAVTQSGMSGRRGVIARSATRLESWVATGAAGIGIVSPGFAPYLAGLGVLPERLVHVPNWALQVTGPLPTPGQRAIIRRELGWHDEEFIALHAGNMGYKQNLLQVVDAARAVADAPIRFVLMGDGSRRRFLEEQAADLPTLSFLPLQPAERVLAVLAAADVLIVSERPSVHDMSLPSKLASYLAAGRPIVAAVEPSGATASMIQRTEAGIVTPAGDPAALLAAIVSLRGDAQLCSRLGRVGQAYARRELTPEAALNRLEAFADGLVQAEPRHAVAAA